MESWNALFDIKSAEMLHFHKRFCKHASECFMLVYEWLIITFLHKIEFRTMQSSLHIWDIIASCGKLSAGESKAARSMFTWFFYLRQQITGICLPTYAANVFVGDSALPHSFCMFVGYLVTASASCSLINLAFIAANR